MLFGHVLLEVEKKWQVEKKLTLCEDRGLPEWSGHKEGQRDILRQTIYHVVSDGKSE